MRGKEQWRAEEGSEQEKREKDRVRKGKRKKRKEHIRYQ